MMEWISALWNSILAFFSQNGWALLRTAVVVIVVVLATGPLARKADHFVRGAFLRFRKDDGATLSDRRAATIGTLLGSIARYALWAVGIAVCLSALGLASQAGSLLATAGISAGLVVGFGAQKLLQDFFAGFVFVVDHPFAVGDLVTIDGRTGVVESLKLRTTTIRSFAGERHILPNGTIAAVTNLSVNDSLALCDIYIPTCHALDNVAPILLEAAQSAAQDHPDVVEPPSVLGVTGMTDRGMYCVRTICRVRPTTHWGMERALRAAQLSALAKAGIFAGGGEAPGVEP